MVVQSQERKSHPREKPGFHPVNTLRSPHKPVFPTQQPNSNQDPFQDLCAVFPRQQYSSDLSPPAATPTTAGGIMVNERSPGKTSSGQYLSPEKPDRRPLANISAKMQSPSPKPPQADKEISSEGTAPQPEFGKASPLRNPLKKPAPSVFMPRPKAVQKHSPQNPLYSAEISQQRHATAASSPTAQKKSFYQPGQKAQPAPAPTYSSALEAAQAFTSQFDQGSYDGAVPIFKPKNPTPLTRAAPSKPTFSSLGPKTHFEPHAPPPRAPVDLTADTDEEDASIDPDAAIREQSPHFGALDPYMYIDSTQANENIKNLLEGAFDADDDKSRTRLRKRAKQALSNGDDKTAKNLANRLQALSVKSEGDAPPDADSKQEDQAQEEDDGTVEGVKVKLLPHQVEGVAWMIDKEIGTGNVKRRPPKGGILADDMGLGKTIQSMTLILTNPRPAVDAKPEHKNHRLPGAEVGKGTLVVAPLALIKQWEDEIKTKIEKSHALRILVHHGPSRTKSATELKKYDVVITTYQTLVSEHAGSDMINTNGSRIGCFGVYWYRLVLDEAHSIKNRNAKSTLAACALQAWFRWCLTGTPMQNNLDELQSLIKFLQIKPYSSLHEWKTGITQPMKNGKGGLAMKRLQFFLKAIMKRRTKDVLKKDGALGTRNTSGGQAGEGASKSHGMQLVQREVITVECEFDQEELDFYQRLQNRADQRIEQIKKQKKADYMGALVLLLRLRQACNHPQLIEMAMSNDRDAMTLGMNRGDRSGGSTDVADGEMDDLTALMGAVSVAARHCDVCQVKLSAGELKDECIRCTECDQDLAALQKKSKTRGAVKVGETKEQRRGRRVIVDSDDEDEPEGEWIADGPEQHIDLGRAGGSDDEDAEGGGDTLGSIDSDRSDDSDSDNGDDEDSPPRAATRNRAHVKAESTAARRDVNEDEDNEAEEELDAASESDSEASILHGLQPSGRPQGKPSTKIRRMLRILHAEVPKHKTIVFSQFTSMLDLIEPHLRSSGLKFVRYDGSMRPDAREESLRLLRENATCRILLCSLKCGSLGLNLTAASRVIIVEPFWNPFVEEQAIDRVHRLNQTVDVKVYRLTVKNTVEAEILNLQNRKRELAKAAIEDGSKAGVNKLSMQDILSLFRRDAEDSAQHHAEDKDMWDKFGNDRRLLDGASAAAEQYGSLSQGDVKSKKGGRERMVKEHAVFGRRW